MLRSPRNQTLRCDSEELLQLQNELTVLNGCSEEQDIINSVINQDIFAAARFMPKRFADLLILDPPYNLSKNYNGNIFRAREKQQYLDWYDSMLRIVFPLLKPDASVYVCADWKTSIIIAPLLEKYFYIQNRITWEREKGRGAKKNWKNNMEDIWLCTVGKQYTFNVDAVKIKRKVIAPYRQNGIPKDWKEEGNVNYRITYPSNLWTDISIPFWSMQENTDHPTQKPEKLIAKAILASSNVDDVVLDPFAGSGTTAVAAKKLGRRFVSVEIDQTYCCWCIKRLRKAELDKTIQGYADGVFLERNLLQKNKKTQSAATKQWKTLL